MLFRYFLQVAGTGKGRVHRAIDGEEGTFLERKAKDGSPKYTETTFEAWYAQQDEAHKAAWTEGAPEGMFYGLDVEEGRMLLSLATGEPADVSELPEGTEQPQDSVMTTDAPEGAEEAAAEQTSDTTDAPAEPEAAPETPAEAPEGTEGEQTLPEAQEATPEATGEATEEAASPNTTPAAE